MERALSFWAPTLSLMLSLIWDRSNEAHPSSPIHLLHLSPSMARLRATFTHYSGLSKSNPLVWAPNCLAIECAVCYSWTDCLLYVHLLAYMLCIYHHQLWLVHEHLFCLFDIIIVVYPLRTIVSPTSWHLFLWYGSEYKTITLATHLIFACCICLYVRVQL